MRKTSEIHVVGIFLCGRLDKRWEMRYHALVR